ncbi:MAG: DinB family protein [Treponema sp.]|jgi:uncharacterized damage-inducible protein DinB|nr:DinB family protein [Treponema sp.]
MERDIYTRLARYNQGVNEKMNGYIQSLTNDEWNHEFKGFFKSIRGICSHLYVGDYSWLKRFENLREFKTLKDPFFTQNLSSKEVLFPDKEDYLARRPELDKQIIALIDETLEGDYPQVLKYANSQGKTFEKKFGTALLQVFNHETHHRGMVSLYLELLGKENDFSSLLSLFP